MVKVEMHLDILIAPATLRLRGLGASPTDSILETSERLLRGGRGNRSSITARDKSVPPLSFARTCPGGDLARRGRGPTTPNSSVFPGFRILLSDSSRPTMKRASDRQEALKSAAVETLHLPFLPDYTLFATLFIDLQNAPFLRRQLLEGNRDFEYAFIDASSVSP